MAAVEASAKGESTTATKLKVTNPDPDVDEDWETIEKPEDFLADSEPVAAAPPSTEDKPAEDEKASKTSEGEGTLGKNALLKDW